jgi:iron complex outermembrane receptor protein
MSHNINLTIGKILAAALWFGTPVLGLAQATSPGESAASGAGAAHADEIQEIVVTAERREERLQSVPIAVSTVSGNSALKSGISNSQDLVVAVPGLSMDSNGGGLSAFLRGVGTTFANAGAEPSVAIYVDGVYIPSAEGAFFNLNNVERVEVLKGPQGTLFGRNATGGVIQVITKEPSSDPSAEISVGYGNDNTSTLNFYGTTGVVPGLATDLGVYADRNPDGWGHNLFNGDSNYTYNNIDLRNSWLWQPQDGTKVRLSLDYEGTTNEAGLGLKPLPGTVSVAGTTFPGFYNTDENIQDRKEIHQGGVALTVTQDLSFATLKSISSWREVRSNFIFDQDASPLPLVNAHIFDPDNTITQELQLLSPNNSPVQWLGGIYYFHDVAGYAPLELAGLGAAPFTQEDISARQHTDSYAAYGQTTIPLSSVTHFTAGIRYTDDRRSIGGTTSGDGVPLAPPSSQEMSFNKVTWRLALDQQFTPDVLGYVSYNTGFKSGLFNTISYAQPAVKPEVLDAYEIGLKSEFFEHRFRANLAAYYYDYKNLQVNETVEGATIVLNAAKAEIYGLDADFTLRPIHNLMLNASFSAIHGRYTGFPNAPYFPPVTATSCSPGVGSVGACTIDATGNETDHTPSFTMHLNADYSIPTDVGPFDLSADFYHNDGFFWDPANQDRQPAYSLINASLGWMNPSERYGVRLWGKNLRDQQYFSFAVPSTLGNDFSPAPPRTYGITFTARF